MKITYTDELQFADAVGINAEYDDINNIDNSINVNGEDIQIITDPYEITRASEFEEALKMGDLTFDVNDELLADYEYNIYYSFEGFRNPITSNKKIYGSADSAKIIYSTICNYYNGGISFIREYLNNDYKSRISNDVHRMLNDYYKKNLGDLESIKEYIRQDIKTCLANGILPVNFKPSEKTLYNRMLAGITSDKPFYATGALIDCLNFTFKIKKSRGVYDNRT